MTNWKERYKAAYEAYQYRRYPAASKDHGLITIQYPPVNTSNGLTRAICNYCMYMNGIGNRINVTGRMVECAERQESGTMLMVKKFMKSTTQKGTADITVQLPNGKVIFVEIKVGKDKPRPAQLKMQERVRAAKGVYEFVSSMDQFYELFDMYGVNRQQSLF